MYYSVLGTVRFWGFDYWYEVLTEDLLVLMNHYFVLFHLIRSSHLVIHIIRRINKTFSCFPVSSVHVR